MTPQLPNKQYATIYADPPWQYGKWGAGSGKGLDMKKAQSFKPHTQNLPLPYPSMPLCEIKALPVKKLANDNCELYLWTTQKWLPKAFEVLDAWGFKYCQILTWCKRPRGLGQGGLYCPTPEFLVLGRMGKMPLRRRKDTTWFETVRPNNAHSKKPDFFRNLIEEQSDAPRIELFARERVLGWDAWGNEV